MLILAINTAYIALGGGADKLLCPQRMKDLARTEPEKLGVDDPRLQVAESVWT